MAFQVETVGRGKLTEDPVFESTRQTLLKVLQDIQKTSTDPQHQSSLEPESMAQAMACISNYQTQTAQGSAFQDLPVGSIKDKMTIMPDRFEIIMDLHGFTAEEISVNVEGNLVDVSAEKKTEEGKSGCLATHRKYRLPKNIQKESLESNLSSEGVLVLSAPWEN